MARKKNDSSSDNVANASESRDKLIEKLHGMYKTDVGLIDYLNQERWMPSGNYLLDLLISGGKGYPLGRFIEISGMDGSGKTVLGIQAACTALRYGGVAVFLISEAKFSHTFAVKIGNSMGVDFNQVIMDYPPSLEHALYGIDTIISTNGTLPVPTVIVMDSIASFCGIESDMKGSEILKLMKQRMGVEPQIFSKWFRSNSYKRLARTNILLIGINQVRSSIGEEYFGSDFVPPGGWSVRHNASVRVQCTPLMTHPLTKKRVDGSTTGTVPGIIVEATTLKNQVFPPLRKVHLPLLFSPEYTGTVGIDDPLTSLSYLRGKNRFGYRSDGRFEYGGGAYYLKQMRDMMLSDINTYQAVSRAVYDTFFEITPEGA